MLKKLPKTVTEKREKELLKDLCRLLKIEFKNFDLQTIKRRQFSVYCELIKGKCFNNPQFIQDRKNLLLNREKLLNFHILNKNNKQFDVQIFHLFLSKTNNLIRVASWLRDFHKNKSHLCKYFKDTKKARDENVKNNQIRNKQVLNFKVGNNQADDNQVANALLNNQISGKLQTPNNLDVDKIVKKDIENFCKNIQKKQVKQDLISKKHLNMLSRKLPGAPDLSDVKKIAELENKVNAWVDKCQKQINEQYKLKNKLLKNEVKQQNKVINNTQKELNCLQKNLKRIISNLEKRNENIEQKIKQNLQNQINRIKLVYENLEKALFEGIFKGNINKLLPLFNMYPNEYAEIYKYKPFIILYINNNEECMKLLREHVDEAILSQNVGVKAKLVDINNAKGRLEEHFSLELPERSHRLLNKKNKNKREQEVLNRDKNLLLDKKLRQHLADYPELKKKAALAYKKEMLTSRQEARKKELKKYLSYKLEYMEDKYLPSEIDRDMNTKINMGLKTVLYKKISKNKIKIEKKINNIIELTSSNKVYLDLMMPIKMLEEKIKNSKLEPLHSLAYPGKNNKTEQFYVPLFLSGFLKYMQISPIFILAENFDLGKFKSYYTPKLSHEIFGEYTVEYNFKIYFVPRAKGDPILISKANFKENINNYVKQFCHVTHGLSHRYYTMPRYSNTAQIYDTWHTKVHGENISSTLKVSSKDIEYWRNQVEIAGAQLRDKYDADLKAGKHLDGIFLRKITEQKRKFLNLQQDVREYNRRIENFDELCNEYKIDINKLMNVDGKKNLHFRPQDICRSNRVENILSNINNNTEQKKIIESSFEKWFKGMKTDLDKKDKQKKNLLLKNTKKMARQKLQKKKQEDERKITSLQQQARDIIELNKVEIDQLPIEAKKLVKIVQREIFENYNANKENYRVSKRMLNILQKSTWDEINNEALHIIKKSGRQFREVQVKRVYQLTISLSLMFMSHGIASSLAKTFGLNGSSVLAITSGCNTLSNAVITGDYSRLHEKFLKNVGTNLLITRVANKLSSMKSLQDFEKAYKGTKVASIVSHTSIIVNQGVKNSLRNVINNKGKGSLKESIIEGVAEGLLTHCVEQNIPNEINKIEVGEVSKQAITSGVSLGIINKLFNKGESTNYVILKGIFEGGVQKFAEITFDPILEQEVGKEILIGEREMLIEQKVNNQQNFDNDEVKEKDLQQQKLDVQILDKPEINKQELDKPVINKQELDKPVINKQELDKPVINKQELDKPVINSQKLDKLVGKEINQKNNKIQVNKKINQNEAKKPIETKNQNIAINQKQNNCEKNKYSEGQKVIIFTAAKNQEKLISDNDYKKNNIKEKVKDKQVIWSNLGKNAMHCAVKVLDLVSMSGEAHGHEIPNNTKLLLEKENLQDLELINSKIHDKNNDNLNSTSDFFANGTNESVFLNLGYDIGSKYQEGQDLLSQQDFKFKFIYDSKPNNAILQKLDYLYKFSTGVVKGSVSAVAGAYVSGLLPLPLRVAERLAKATYLLGKGECIFYQIKPEMDDDNVRINNNPLMNLIPPEKLEQYNNEIEQTAKREREKINNGGSLIQYIVNMYDNDPEALGNILGSWGGEALLGKSAVNAGKKTKSYLQKILK